MTKNIHFEIEGGYQYEAFHHGICFQKSWHQLKYRKALELLGSNPNEKILDAACGSGVLTNLMAQHIDTKIIGADFSEAAIKFCTEKYAGENVEFILLDLQEKYFKENTFTAIVMLEAIEHFTSPVAETILKNLYAYLKPGGKLIISTPNKNSFWTAIEFLLDAFRLTPRMKNEQHVKLYTKSSFKKILEETGFTVKRIETTHFIAPWMSFLGLKTAEKFHAAEQKAGIFPGSLLFAVAEKK